MSQDDAKDPGTDDLADTKAKMREALDRKNARAKGVHEDGPLREKAHGSEVQGGAGPRMHRRKAGGGGS
ncbi:MAG TPA: DUF5302 domain-containing protein [Nocardioides sp.]|uniref:DUF5302 domain-containing protein n=1 Tax=Nocardioides sp. TaxID=35761 RepID=UPI002F42E325